jgi:hypothetical protein
VQPPTMNGAVAALRFFFTTTCNRPEMARHLTLVRQAQKLPVVLTPEEVARLIEAAPGPKYKSLPPRRRGPRSGSLTAPGCACRRLPTCVCRTSTPSAWCSASSRAKARRTATACYHRGCWRCCGSGGWSDGRRRGCFRAAIRFCQSHHASSIGSYAKRPTRSESKSACHPIHCVTASRRIFLSKVWISV